MNEEQQGGRMNIDKAICELIGVPHTRRLSDTMHGFVEVLNPDADFTYEIPRVLTYGDLHHAKDIINERFPEESDYYIIGSMGMFLVGDKYTKKTTLSYGFKTASEAPEALRKALSYCIEKGE